MVGLSIFPSGAQGPFFPVVLTVADLNPLWAILFVYGLFLYI
jgi:hypothetical protein